VRSQHPASLLHLCPFGCEIHSLRCTDLYDTLAFWGSKEGINKVANAKWTLG
jgi:hypothetical protein